MRHEWVNRTKLWLYAVKIELTFQLIKRTNKLADRFKQKWIKIEGISSKKKCDPKRNLDEEKINIFVSADDLTECICMQVHIFLNVLLQIIKSPFSGSFRATNYIFVYAMEWIQNKWNEFLQLLSI